MNPLPRGLLSRLDGDSLRLKLAPTSFFDSVEPTWSIESRPFHDHDFFYCFDGEARFSSGGKATTLSSGKGMLVRTGDVVTARHGRAGKFRVFAQHFELRLYGKEDLPLQMELAPSIRFPDRKAIEEPLARIAALQGKPGGALIRHGLFLPILLDFLTRAWKRDRTMAPESGVLHRIEEGLKSRAGERDALAQAMALAPWDPGYTAKKFSKLFGSTPKQYLIRLQMDKARELLETGMAVKQVAMACGFDDELYFSRLFRKKEGRPPTAHPKIW